MDMGLISARDRQANRLRPGSQQQTVVGNGFATSENHSVARGSEKEDKAAA
jgi:hypothetical protein